MTSLQAFIAKAADELLHPFLSWENFLDAAAGVPHALTSPGNGFAWWYLLSSLALAGVLHRVWRRKGWIAADVSLTRFLFPREVYLQRSAIVDYKFVLVHFTIKGLFFTPFVTGFSWFIYKMLLPVTTHWLTFELPVQSPMLRVAIITVAATLIADFGFFLSHLLLHRIGFLWPFHEVHHSAEVLTPVTVARFHPVETLVTLSTSSVVGAVGATIFTAVGGVEADGLTILGINVFLFGFLFFAFQLRHTHIWFSYGPVLERIFISPAQHQIHHSLDRRHWGKNYGYMLAIWDALWGTLYVPRSRETLSFGVPGDPQDFSSVSKLYLLPFVKAWRRLRRAPRPVANADAGDVLSSVK